MSSLLFIIMLAYTLVWFSINIYNIFPLINYYIVGRRKEDKPDYVLPKDLPSISILIPAYREELVLGNCISRIFESDYPTELLDVIILTERDDQGTMAIAHELSKKYGIKHVQVEESIEPKGKPRALNFGLRHVRGDIVGVIDAEDIIAKELFREVALMMSSGYDAVQGVLDMVNDRDGYMNMHLRAEYRYWYHTYLPALQYSNFPIPLGGTTNFFRRSVLKDLEGWDPYNVTEDFELGLRLYNEHKRVGNIYDMLKDRRAQSIFRNNYKFSLLESVTQEESPTTMSGWLRQRTRWQRGKIQTFRKIAKKPPQAATSKLHSIMMSLIPHLGPINLTGIAYSLYIYIFQWHIHSSIPLLHIRIQHVHDRILLRCKRVLILQRSWQDKEQALSRSDIHRNNNASILGNAMDGRCARYQARVHRVKSILGEDRSFRSAYERMRSAYEEIRRCICNKQLITYQRKVY